VKTRSGIWRRILGGYLAVVILFSIACASVPSVLRESRSGHSASKRSLLVYWRIAVALPAAASLVLANRQARSILEPVSDSTPPLEEIENTKVVHPWPRSWTSTHSFQISAGQGQCEAEPERVGNLVKRGAILMDLSLLHGVTTKALHQAARALSLMTGHHVTMFSSMVEIVSPERLLLLLDKPEEPVIAAHVAFRGDMHGHMVVMFLPESAEKLTRAVLGEGRSDSEMASSLIAEIGNVACSCVISAFADSAEIRIVPDPPDLALDMGGALLSCLAGAVSASGEDVLAIKTEFMVDEEVEHGYLFCLAERSDLYMLIGLLQGKEYHARA
jgi:chemotaxis protein CheC